MDLLDVNALVNAYRRDAPDHPAFRRYVQALCGDAQPFAVPSVVFSGFLRIVTHPRIFSLLAHWTTHSSSSINSVRCLIA